MGMVLVLLAFAIQLVWLATLSLVRDRDSGPTFKILSLFLLLLSGFFLALAEQYVELEGLYALWAGAALLVVFMDKELSTFYRMTIIVIVIVEIIAIAQPLLRVLHS